MNAVLCSPRSNHIVPVTDVTNEQNLDDSLSVVSDSAAWSTDLITNSDSDLESNSPSKYTPYSTYSSNCSGNNQTSLINQNLINALSSANSSQIANFNLNQNVINFVVIFVRYFMKMLLLTLYKANLSDFFNGLSLYFLK